MKKKPRIVQMAVSSGNDTEVAVLYVLYDNGQLFSKLVADDSEGWHEEKLPCASLE